MEVREGYKQTEVGVIPEDWEVKSLNSISEKIMVGIASAATHAYRPRGVPMFRNQNIKPGFLDDSDMIFISESYEFIYKNKRLKGGDLLTARTGYPGTTSLVPSEYENAQSFTTLITRPRTGFVNPEYLCCFMNSAAGQFYFEQNQIGGGQKNVNAASLKQLPVPLPPTKVEQEAIAEALSDADALIESLELLIAKKRQIKQGAMQDLLAGKKRLPGFSGEWEEKLLPEVSRFRGGKAHEQHIAEHGRFVCVNSKFISTEGKIRKYTTANFCCAKLKDILMVMSDLPNGKALAKAFLVDVDDLYAVNQRVCALSVFDDYCAEFLSYILNRNPYFLKFDDGVSQTHLLNRVFQKCSLTLPPTMGEQIAIAEILSDMGSEIQSLESKLFKARQLKQGMMQELLTGSIRLI